MIKNYIYSCLRSGYASALYLSKLVLDFTHLSAMILQKKDLSWKAKVERCVCIPNVITQPVRNKVEIITYN